MIAHSAALQWLLCAWLSLLLQPRVQAFRILNDSSELTTAPSAVFEPYVRGEVGYFGDATNPDTERVNEGSPFSPDTPRVYFSGAILQNCPGMVGPINDQEYYCRGRAYGYCDRRSGLCVCNIGYTGVDCSECKPSFFKQGGLCYPKKSCPNDCSQGGTCDYATGKCTCVASRKGEDCSQVFCQFDPLCTSCTSTTCRSCVEGFYVDPATQTCASCKKHDPRCLVCDAQSCLACADPLLNSVRRSGARFLDAPLPFDELTREFSFTFAYGSQHARVFDEAEAFVLAPGAFLNESSRTCAQGINADATWSCKPFSVSHRVCGHTGVFSFGSPVYAIAESAGTITLTVRRSGGGLGTASLLYDVQHLTASANDVSPTAFYTSSQLLVFDEGVVKLSFQLTIHDDHVVEGDETFRVTLREPEFDAMTDASRRSHLGNQRQALVTILDDDVSATDASLSFVIDADTTLLQGGRAGADLTFQIQSVLGTGAARTTSAKDASVFLVESYASDIEDESDSDSLEVFRPKQLARVVDNTDGTYTCTWQRKHAGEYTVAVYVLYPGGLRGDYYDDAWLDLGSASPVITRIDRHVNFTWGTGALFPGASDYVSVRWSGRIKPKSTGDVTFHVVADDHVRLWIDDLLLLDRWDDAFSGSASATVTLDATQFYSLVLDYRELTGRARVQLYWSSASVAKEIVPAANLFSEQPIRSSPFTNVSVRPASTASVSTSVIRGVLTSIVGSVHRIEVVPVDAHGNPRRVLDARDRFEAQFTLVTDQSLGGIGSKLNDAEIVWSASREAFQVSWSPQISGVYDLDVSINGVKVVGSPFAMTVAPSAMHATRSVVSGAGLLANRVAGVTMTLLVEARDVYNNRIWTGGNAAKLDVRAFHTTQLSAIEVGAVVDNGDGTYTLTYTPRVAGSYNVRVRLRGVDVNNSPYVVSVVPNAPVGTTSTASGAGLATASTNVQASFQVTTRDLHANLVTQGGATIQVVVEHPTKGNTTGSCSDLLTGTYACTYTARYVGASKLHVVLTVASATRAVSGSPFPLTVVSGPALGTLSLAQGSGLVSSIAGVRANFTVFVRDAFDNEKRNAGTETIAVAFIGPAPATTAIAAGSSGLSVTFLGDDKFLVTYVLTVKGRYSISVSVNGVDVVASPFSMYTYPAEASPVTTTLDLVSPVAAAASPVVFTAGALIVSRLTTRDAFGNVLESGGYAFQLSDVATFQDKPLVDEGNGSYVLSLRPVTSTTFPFVPKILLVGGLNGTYFANPDLVGPAVRMRQDAAINVDFGVTPPSETDAMETFSVRWSGFVRPAYSEVFAFDVDVLGGVRLSVGTTPLLLGAWPDAAHMSAPQPTQVALTANQFVPLELNYTKPKALPNGRIRLRWQSATQKREVVPSSRLYTSWRIVNNVPELEIVPAAAYAPSFTAEFAAASIVRRASAAGVASPVTITATAGAPLVFRVVARDQFGNQRLVGGDVLQVVFPQLSATQTPSPLTVVDAGDATYTISVSPILTGSFTMVIAAVQSSTTGYQSLDPAARALFLAPYNIQQSPFTLVVQPNKPLATTSTITGTGFVQATAGVRATFTLQLRDLYSNAIDGDPDPSEARLPVLPRVLLRPVVVSPTGTDVIASVTRSPDGTFEVTYTATRTGLYQVLLSTDDGATFTSKSATLRVYPNVASALASSITGGTGLGPQIAVRQQVTYSVSLRDFYSNSMELGGNNLVVVLRGPEVVYPTTITDVGTSAYVVAYEVPVAGSYEIQTYLASHRNGLTGSYFTTTRFGGSVPATQVLDAQIQFDWRANETMRSYPRIRWTGFIKPKYTERYNLTLSVAPLGAVYIDQVCVLDALNVPLPTDVHDLRAEVDFVGGRLHAIAIEYRSPSARDVFGFLSLQWTSDRQRLEAVPSTALFPSAHEIHPSNKSGNVPVNEYVQLAAELRSCMAFEPKRWRKVLDKSSAVLLPSSGCRPQLDAASTKKRRQLSAIRPSSRDEDTESVVLPHVHALSHRHVPTSLAAYLSQPAMVRAILDEASAELDDTSTSYEQQGTSERTQRAIDATSDGLDALPLAMTPRTCQQLARLPAPQADDIAAIDAMEQMASSAELARNFYRMLQRQQQRSRVTGKTQHDAQRRVATVRSKHALPRARVTKHRSQTNAAASPDKSKHHTTMRDEQACMAMEDVDAVATVAARPTPDATTQCSGVSDARQQLLHEQASAAIATQTAETHVAETLAAIQHLLPLELIYAFGKGAFASPAQQRAAHVLARVTTRLRFRRVATAMAQWQRVVADIVAQEQDAAALCLQCAWRQTRAVRERTARERIRRELRRRQEALLRLLASKQNASASVLTRALRRYAHRCAHERQIRATLAATHIQKFWRERQALWVALRIQLRKQQRQRAAVCIQRHVRGRLARRRRRLLEKIQHVDAMRQRKQQLALERQHTIERTGAVLLIQRTVRKWRQRRVLALRRRRAQFERDKRAIVKVQAQYRSRKAQRWFVSHVLAVHRAVRTLQRAWRCYVARCTLASLVQARDTQRRVWRDEIAERRRKQHSSNRAVVKQHVKKTWGQLTALKDRVTNTGATGATGPSPREVQAAKQLQAYWRGLRTRKRLRHERARQRELARRAVNRSRRLAATCIQRRVRGIQGRALAWRRMVHRSAMRIQSAWRGVRTRRQLVRTKRALLAITRMQQQWRARRSADALRQRQRAASTIQTRARVFLGRRWLQRMVRRQQFLSEEHAMGKALLAATRRRVQDELLLQSFVYKDIAFPSASDDSESDTTRVDRSLFRANRTRRGYDGVWQEVFRSATGGAREIDNARFVRFLKALPHAFVHKTSFPTHTIDVVFAKMKEPKARTLSFARFTAAMLVVWRDKFGANGDDHTRFLRFMRDFVLPSTLQRGKFRSLLDAHCAQRMLWAVHILRRFAARIATRKCHDAFVVAHAQQQVLRHRERCARVIETSYGRYRFRQQLRALLAQMFIEFVDHTGHAVRYEHVLTHRVITGTRPRLLHGVACARVVPLPFPGEEFHAFCERHEDSSCQSARVPADLYCVVCEDAMCHVCFRRDHAKRAALAQHETRAIRVCSHCRTETATRECLHCGNGHVPFCDACFPHVHTAAASSNPNDATGVQATPLDAHAFHALVVMCIECASRVAQWRCETCADVFCKRCLTTTHARGQRQHHACARLSYFSVLKQTAEDARRASASKAQAQMNKERAAARAERARELALRHASATKIQALVRSFVARQHGRAYMKLVRQTHAAKAQRLKDERTRSSLVYKVQHAFGVSPALKSDTAQETAARRQRIDAIKATLFLHRRVLRRTTDGDGTGPSAFTHEKRRWSKRARARVQRAAHTWCVYGVRVKIVRGAWRNSVGSILSTQHVLTTGYIVVFVALANRAVVVAYDHVAPFDDDEILRQAYEAPSRVVADAAHDAHATVSRVLEGLVRKAQLLYLQTIAYHDIAPLAWVVEYNRVLQRPEFWNVVLNKRTLEAPRAMELIERMDEGERQVLDARVAAARAKLLALLHPFTPKDMPALTRRRPACAFLPLKRSKRVEVVDVSAQDATWSNDAHVRAVSCARLWHETIAPSDALGGARVTSKFLRACATPPHSTRACWRVVELWQWMELYDSDGYEAHAKAFFRLSADAQLYVADDIAAAVDGGNLSDARAKLLQLLKLKDETLQLLVFNQAQQRAAAEDAVAAAAEATAS